MKEWNTPTLEELDIKETSNGYFNVGIESPFDILLKREEKKPTTPTSGQ